MKGTGGPAIPAYSGSTLLVTGPDPNLEEISWDEWFRAFDESGLAFVYETDQPSTFHKLVSRETAEARSKR